MAALCSLQLLPEVLPKNPWALTNSATVFEGEKTWLPFKIESIQANSQSAVLTIKFPVSGKCSAISCAL